MRTYDETYVEKLLEENKQLSNWLFNLLEELYKDKDPLLWSVNDDLNQWWSDKLIMEEYEKAKQASVNEQKKERALAKLTDEEKKLLGLEA